MLIPKGRTIAWGGVTYRPGQKVAPAHKSMVRKLLLAKDAAPVEPEAEEEPIEKTVIVEDSPEVPEVTEMTESIGVSSNSEGETEEKPKRSRRKRKKETETDVDES